MMQLPRNVDDFPG